MDENRREENKRIQRTVGGLALGLVFCILFFIISGLIFGGEEKTEPSNTENKIGIEEIIE